MLKKVQPKFLTCLHIIIGIWRFGKFHDLNLSPCVNPTKLIVNCVIINILYWLRHVSVMTELNAAKTAVTNYSTYI